MSNIHWYPGHIAKAKAQLREHIKLVDVVIEVIDARLPVSSRFAKLNELIGNKQKLILINKADLADPHKTNNFIRFLEEQGEICIEYNALTHQKANKIVARLTELGQPTIEKLVTKGLLPRAIRTMVLGMPNVGKSSVINSLVKKSKAKVESKAGVTKTLHWIRIHPKVELLDTPGIIPSVLEDQEGAMKLACVNSVGEKSYDPLEISKALITFLEPDYKDCLKQYYHLEENEELSLEAIAKSRKWLLDKGRLDIQRASSQILADFRHGRMGRVTLEAFS